MPSSPGPARRAITLALFVGTFLSSLEVVVVSPAMPAVVTELGRAGLYPWVFTVYIAFQTLTMPLYGLLADRAGRREAWVLGVALFLAGSVACAMADSMPALVLARGLQGLGAGALLPLTMTIFGDLYEVGLRTRMQGLFSLVWGLSSLGGPLLGGWLTEAFSWRAIFWLNLLPGLFALAVVGALLPSRFGIVGLEERRRTGGWGALWRSPTQQAVNLSGLALGVALLGVITFLPVQVQAVGGGSATQAGIALIPMSVSWTLAANACGYGVLRHGFRAMARLGLGLAGAGAAAAAWWTANPVGLVLFGAGMGFTISTFTVSSQEAAPLPLRGVATSLALFSRSLGAAAGVPLLAALAGIRGGAEDFASIPDLEGGVARAFVAIGAAALVAAVIVFARFPLREEPPG